MKNTHVLHICIGLVLGALIISGFCYMNHHRDTAMSGGMNHDMNGTMSMMMANLEGKTGDAFDAAFIDEMIMHHEGAVLWHRLHS